jgi:hypothetical protein
LEYSVGVCLYNCQQQLDSLTLERLWVVTQARKKWLAEEETGYQLSGFDIISLISRKKFINQIEFDHIDKLMFGDRLRVIIVMIIPQV